jgi:hypothetical protein
MDAARRRRTAVDMVIVIPLDKPDTVLILYGNRRDARVGS